MPPFGDTDADVYPGWLADDVTLLPALRTLYEYDEVRRPDRATGWLWSSGCELVPPMEWPEVLAKAGPAVQRKLRKDTGVNFVVSLFQAYKDGAGVSWHYDREWDSMAILSLGVPRSFGLRRNDDDHEVYRVNQHGDLIFMPPGFQLAWEHCVPVEEAKGERCSLVFRTPA